ncbi:PEP/pyruvate-binding domain-containing protein [Candidatus Daviesbacteria bacterium]|nr:PEP/pyruvate-binding domain-containing protein [Candidatus Daviesbacteria bacterium]
MYIKLFNEISKNDVKEVGGKGASLGEMTNAGIPVPPGFVITTEANGVIHEEEILKAFDTLNTERVSVRSSAIAEDSLRASWAGQLETYLNVTRENLIESIKKCRESVKSERAKTYAKEYRLSDDQLAMAVVIQKMVDAKAAGVMFTANPVTSDKEEIMIESVLGLGEKLVQGSVTPDNFIVDKGSVDIKSKDLQGEQTIADEVVKKLVELGKKIEKHWGSPQDIEWAIDTDNMIWILQSRPITNL